MEVLLLARNHEARQTDFLKITIGIKRPFKIQKTCTQLDHFNIPKWINIKNTFTQ